LPVSVFAMPAFLGGQYYSPMGRYSKPPLEVVVVTRYAREIRMGKEKLVSKEETKLIPGKGRYPIPAYKGPERIISKTGELYEGGIYYHIFEKHAEIYKYDPGLKYLKIPKEIRGVPVTVISSMNNMLLNKVALETVSIPEGVVEISNNAFANCRNLKKVKLPESLTKIDNMAFYYCTGLKEITIPDNVETIG